MNVCINQSINYLKELCKIKGKTNRSCGTSMKQQRTGKIPLWEETLSRPRLWGAALLCDRSGGKIKREGERWIEVESE